MFISITPILEAFHTLTLVFRTKKLKIYLFIQQLFIHLQRNKQSSVSNKVLIISNANELFRVKPERVVYVESDGNYSTMVLHDKTELVFTMNLAHCQQLIEEQLGKEAETFIRIGKQLIVNRAYIFKVNPTKQQLIMSNMKVNNAFELQASKEALKQLKAYLESTIGKEAKL